eukprot:scaffold66575_cov54-Phaeocystis_antarctica.AAC.1
MSESCAPDVLLEAVRGLRVAEPDLGFKPLLAKLRQQQPDLGAATKEVREALAVLKAESEAAQAAAAVPPAAAPPAAVERGAPLPVALSLACIGCFRLPSDMDDGREKHPICDKCLDEKLPTTYLCGVNCPANPGAWQLHGVFHKKLRKERKAREDGGLVQQLLRENAELHARHAAQSGDEYSKLLAEGVRYESKEDWRKAGKVLREAIALRPDEPTAYFNLGNVLNRSRHIVEAAQRYLEAKERFSVGSGRWAMTTALAFDLLLREECDQVAKPEWWNDEGLKALSARVMRAAPNDQVANLMRAEVLRGVTAWELGPRTAAERKEAAAHFERAAALCHAPVGKAELTVLADWCRSQAEAMPCWFLIHSARSSAIAARASRIERPCKDCVRDPNAKMALFLSSLCLVALRTPPLTSRRQAAISGAAAAATAALVGGGRIGGAAAAEPPYCVAMTVLLDPQKGSRGELVIEVMPEWAPLAAARFKELVELGFYKRSRFHRVLQVRV